MPTVDAVVTIKGFEAAILEFASGLGTSQIDTFKVGEGGFITDVGGNIPRAPSPLLTDLDIIENPGRYVVDPIPSFQKAITATNIVADANGFPILEVDCLLDFADYNDDGTGSDPQIYEIGLFAGTKMVAYGTFNEQVKNAAIQIPFQVRIVSGGG